MTNLKFPFLVIALIAASNSFASIAPKSETKESDSQMINLNMQFKAKNKTVKSDLTMPYYQTAELDKKVDNKNIHIELNPRKGKNSNEVEIEMKIFKSNNSKSFTKKEIIAKMGEESKIKIKGLTVKVKPVLD